MINKLDVLVVTATLPMPDTSAGDRRFFELLTIIAGRHAVDLLLLVSPHERLEGQGPIDYERYRQMYERIGVKLIDSKRDLSIEQLLASRAYHLGIFMFWHCAEWVGDVFRRFQPWAKVAIDTVDVHFLREESALALGIDEPAAVEDRKRREISTYQLADAVILLTAEDRRALEQIPGMSRQFLIPIIVDSRRREDRPRDRELLFVGGFKHEPNGDGILWFAREAWPAIRAAVLDARLTIVGSSAPPEIQALGSIEGVEMLGYVPETGPYLDRAAVSIAPLRYGGGMKGKVVEAMASAMPVVTTTVGAQGLGATSGEHLVIADDAAGFARATIELLNDPARAATIGRAGQGLMAGLCSTAAARAQVEAMLEGLVRPGRVTIPPSKLVRSAWVLASRLTFKPRRLAWRLSTRLRAGRRIRTP